MRDWGVKSNQKRRLAIFAQKLYIVSMSAPASPSLITVQFFMATSGRMMLDPADSLVPVKASPCTISRMFADVRGLGPVCAFGHTDEYGAIAFDRRHWQTADTLWLNFENTDLIGIPIDHNDPRSRLLYIVSPPESIAPLKALVNQLRVTA